MTIMSKYQGLARVSVRCKPFPGVNVAGTVRPLGYHPHTFNGDGRSRADWHRRIREGRAR